MGRQLGGGTRRQVIEPKPVHLRVIMYRLKSLVRVFHYASVVVFICGDGENIFCV